MFQFYAITFGSSFFNMILGYVKFAAAIGFMQNSRTRVFMAYVGVVIASTMEWIYTFIIVMNNFFLYMVAGILYHDPYWLDFNKYFLKHYKINFTLATLVLPGLFVSVIHVARLSYILKTCFDRIGSWRTLCLLKNSPLVFVHSTLTNLAIFDNFIVAEMEEKEENVAMWTSAAEVIVPTIQKEKKRSLSLPCDRLVLEQPLRNSSLPLIFNSSTRPLWKPVAPRDVPVARPTSSDHLHIAHRSELEKDFTAPRAMKPNCMYTQL